MVSVTVAFSCANSLARLGSRVRRLVEMLCCTCCRMASPPLAKAAGSCLRFLADLDRPAGLAGAGAVAGAGSMTPATAG